MNNIKLMLFEKTLKSMITINHVFTRILSSWGTLQLSTDNIEMRCPRAMHLFGLWDAIQLSMRIKSATFSLSITYYSLKNQIRQHHYRGHILPDNIEIGYHCAIVSIWCLRGHTTAQCPYPSVSNLSYM